MVQKVSCKKKEGKMVCKSISIILTFLTACSSGMSVDNEEDAVESVINGNTVQLSSGLTVHLLGISPGNSFTEQYLRSEIQNKGRTLGLISDSGNDDTFTSYDDEVWAYAQVMETGEPLNRTLLTLAGKSSYSSEFLNDSLVAFEAIFNTPASKHDLNQLASKLKSASMLVRGQDNQGGFIGTAFFINENGLALSNSHVVHPGADYTVYLSDANGNLSEHGYRIRNLVYAGDYSRTPEDYAIFYVDLDDDAKRSIHHLKLSDKKPSAGDLVATVGNPAPGSQILNMSFSHGTISAIRDSERRLQIQVPIQGGFSGGPLVDQYGEVVGISSSGWSGSDAELNYAVDIQMVRDKLNEKNLPYAGK